MAAAAAAAAAVKKREKKEKTPKQHCPSTSQRKFWGEEMVRMGYIKK